MKQWKTRAAALGLALVLALAPPVSASEAMGNEIQSATVRMSIGTSLTKQIFWSDTYSDLRTERYFTYTPSNSVTPTVVYGDKVLTRATLTAMAKTLEDGGRRVVGGINGDLYVLATGVPLGAVVTDGVVRSLPSSDNFGYYAVGFRTDGTAFIGQPKLAATVTFKGFTFPLGGGINKVRSADTNYVLYTPDFAATTQNSEPGIDVVLTPVLDELGKETELDLDVRDGEGAGEAPFALSEVKGGVVQSALPTVGGRVTYRVEQVLDSVGAIPIPQGKAILSINGKSSSYFIDYIRLLQPGDRVDLDITAEEAAWKEADQAMGGLSRLVTAGVVDSFSIAAGAQKDRNAYSAVGVKADGTAVFYTVDGKQPGYSIGATLTQVAMRLVELGCVDAISLDGGGSTTIGGTYPDGSGTGVVNKPSDGSQRANSVALFLTTALKPSGVLAGAYVTPGEGLLLSGARLQLSSTGLDSNYYTMPVGEAPTWSVENGDGMVSASGVFTAGGSSGVTQVTAGYDGMKGSAAITVVSVPDRISLVNGGTGTAVTALALDPGAQIDLNAVAAYRGLTLTSQDDCFTWSMDSAVGTVDAQGVVTAGTKSASGSLTVSAGGKSTVIPVAVAGHVHTLENFESGIGSVTAFDGLTLEREFGSDHVRYGSASLKVRYDAAAGPAASLVTTLVAAAGERYLNLWVYGDGTANSLTATFADSEGFTKEVMLTGLDFTGWKYITAAIPEGASALRSINLIFGDVKNPAGTFWLDQLTTSNETIRDEAAPTVTVSRTDSQLTAAVVDLIDKKFTAAQVKATYDGAALAGTFDPASGLFKAALPASDGRLHRVAVTAADASGNLGRGTVNIDATAERDAVFTDAAGHWAEGYAVYLYDRRVTNGIPGTAEGELLFQPDKAITRGELFALAGRWLGLDFTKYADVALPFADADKIPDWVLPSVKAMYALGYLKGSSTGDDRLFANVETNISRAEAMTVLGRMQARGYAQADLTAFGDGSVVPDWAAGHLKTLVGQGVVSGGADGLLRPGDLIKRGEVAKILFTMT